MRSRKQTVALAVSVVGLLMLVLIQILSWREHQRLNSGAFLLLVFIIAPLFTKDRSDTR
jgi:uncharacterized membrane protein (DUF441 family)